MKPTPLRIEYVPLAALRPYERNARTHSSAQVDQIAASIREFGWTNPILVDGEMNVVAGHGRIEAAKRLGFGEGPIIRLAHLTEQQRRALIIADNKLALNAGWDEALLAAELQGLGDLQSLVGFSSDELIKLMRVRAPGRTDPDDLPAPPRDVITRPGDVWQCERHTVVCGSCADASAWDALPPLGLVLTDPPYGIGLAYADAQQEDSEANLVELAAKWLPLARSRSPVVAFTCGVTRQWIYPAPNWVLCWFYGGGQFRSPWGFNCWQPILCYGADPSLASGHGCRPDAFDLNVPAQLDDIAHPCPKPMALWDLLLARLAFSPTVVGDCFGGSGTTLIACERLGHTAALIEQSPLYCDVAVERWQRYTGKTAERRSLAKAA